MEDDETAGLAARDAVERYMTLLDVGHSLLFPSLLSIPSSLLSIPSSVPSSLPAARSSALPSVCSTKH